MADLALLADLAAPRVGKHARPPLNESDVSDDDEKDGSPPTPERRPTAAGLWYCLYTYLKG